MKTKPAPKPKPKEPVAYVCVFCYSEVPEDRRYCKKCGEYKGVCGADKCPSCGELVARWDKKCQCGADNPNAGGTMKPNLNPYSAINHAVATAIAKEYLKYVRGAKADKFFRDVAFQLQMRKVLREILEDSRPRGARLKASVALARALRRMAAKYSTC